MLHLWALSCKTLLSTLSDQRADGIEMHRGEFGLGVKAGDKDMLPEFIQTARSRDMRLSFKRAKTPWELHEQQ